jgi:hypothetical protein
LPLTAFVYVKHVRDKVDHIQAYDTATAKDWTITTLDDDGSTKGTAVVGRLAISSDRKRIAFAATFRTNLGDEVFVGDAQAIWVTTADGVGFTRVTPFLPRPQPSGCKTIDDQICTVAGLTCNVAAATCVVPGLSVDRSNPAWFGDELVWFTFSTTTPDPTSPIGMGIDLSLAYAQADGTAQQEQVMFPEAMCSEPSTSPDGALLAAYCSPLGVGRGEIYILDASKKKKSSFTVDASGLVGWADAKTLLVEQGGPATSFIRVGVDGTGEKAVFAGQDKSHDISWFAFSPDGNDGVVAAGDTYAKSCDLTWVKADGTKKAVSSDGKSCSPARR